MDVLALKKIVECLEIAIIFHEPHVDMSKHSAIRTYFQWFCQWSKQISVEDRDGKIAKDIRIFVFTEPKLSWIEYAAWIYDYIW